MKTKPVQKLRLECLENIVRQLNKQNIPKNVQGVKLWMVDNYYKKLFDRQYTPKDMANEIVTDLENNYNDFRLDKIPFEILSNIILPNGLIAILDNCISCEFIIPQTATIEMIPNRGSFHQERYTLDLIDKAIYNIGRYKTPQIPGTYRENYIAINENDTDPQLRDINRHVSKAHADIRVIRGAFYLHATMRGCEKGTKIIRNEEEIILKSHQYSKQLYDQDIIVLGNEFMMRFRM